MPRDLPYFAWYAKDAETDELYVSMTDEEVGFYHRLLNKAWINVGLPADLNELAKLMHRSRRSLEKLWAPKVSRCWFAKDGRLYNARQEEERAKAARKSEACASAVRTRYHRPTDVGPDVGSNVGTETGTEALRVDYEPPTTHTPRALARADSVCVYESVFQVFCARFPRKVRLAAARSAWNEVITSDSVNMAMACLDRYLASDEVSRGVIANPDTWLRSQALDQWRADWPAARIQKRTRYEVTPISPPTAEQEIEAIRALLEDENETEEYKIVLRKRLAELDAAS